MAEEGEGGIFSGLFETDEAEPEYPIQSMVIDRRAVLGEGCSSAGFVPRRECFDPPQTAGDAAAPIERHAALPDIVVYYRNKRHSLWGHRLWNAAKYLVKRMDMGWIAVQGKAVLELGAGLGVPSLAAFHNGARLCVVTDYPDADLLHLLQRNVAVNCRPGEGRAGPASAAVVEPLLWGNAEHLRGVLRHTGGAGFDVVLLSDILFNHVCNDDLADTLAATLRQAPEAVGYCVFSHHRAQKQRQDLAFFDQCAARGLAWAAADEEDYPLMFPEDRGPEAVRRPVKCYTLRWRYDAAGPSLPARDAFDVVVQGTGAVQAILAAALARSGRRVLHCDGQGDYGAAHQTLPLPVFRDRLRSRLSSSVFPAAAGIQTPVIGIDRCPDNSQLAPSSAELGNESGDDALNLRRVLVDVLPSTYLSNGATVQELVRSGMAPTMEFQTLSGFVFLHPLAGEGKEKEKEKRKGKGSAVSESDDTAVDVVASKIPLTRGAIFATDTLGLIEKRRIMKFVKDVAAQLAEELHAHGASPADNLRMQQAAAREAARKATEQFADAAASHPGITLGALLEEKYGLSPKARDIVTLMGEIDLRDAPLDHEKATPALVRSVELFRQLVTSIGLYGGTTPFLHPLFGASEMVQAFCRTAAVWGGVYVLQRSLRYVGVNEKKEQQYAVLSNGQWVSAKVIVAPRELLPADPEGALPVYDENDWQAVLRRAKETVEAAPGSDPRYLAKVKSAQKDIQWSRLVVVLRRPLLTWAHLGEPSDGTTKDNNDKAPPSVVALMRAQTHRPRDKDDKGTAVPTTLVQLTQHSHETSQVPPGDAVILHFTADAVLLSQAELEAFVMKHFCLKGKSSDGNDASSEKENHSGVLPRIRFEDGDVVFFASFTLSAVQAALDGLQVPEPQAAVDIPSETRHTHPYAIEECLKLESAIEKDCRALLHERDVQRHGGSESSPSGEVESPEQSPKAMQVGENTVACEHLRVVSVPTLLPGLLNDSQYMEEAKIAYKRVVDLLLGDDDDAKKNYVFMEKVPDATVF